MEGTRLIIPGAVNLLMSLLKLSNRQEDGSFHLPVSIDTDLSEMYMLFRENAEGVFL